LIGKPGEDANNALAGDREIHSDADAFAGEFVEDHEHAKLSAAAPRIVDESSDHRLSGRVNAVTALPRLLD
jgi:hypothetical protein